MKATVIGGAGRMGRWLVKHFIDLGYNVTIADINMKDAMAFANKVGADVATTNQEAVENASLIVISVPIESTVNVINKIASYLTPSMKLIEIASLKSNILPFLKKIVKEKRVTVISLHPLFGPGVRSLNKKRIALIPVSDPNIELRDARKLFPSADIFVVNVDVHDRIMALTLSVPHFINIAFASLISEEDLRLLKRLGGTTFSLQLIIAEGVMSEDPNLYASIQMNNVYTRDYLEKLLLKMKELKVAIDNKNVDVFKQIYNASKSQLSKDEQFNEAYSRMYRALERLNELNFQSV